MKISIGIVKEIEKDIARVLETYQEEMDKAYLLAGDNPLDIKISLNIRPEKGKLRIQTGINFVKDRCKDTVTSFIDEAQINLFEEGAETYET